MNAITKNFLARSLKFVLFWIIVGGLIYLLGRFLILFLPFIIAFVLTAAITPLKKFLIRRFHFPIMAGVLTSMLIVVGGLGGIISLLVARLSREIHDIYLHWPFYSHVLERFFSHWINTVETVYLNLPTTYNTYLNSTLTSMLHSVPSLVNRGFSMAVAIPEWIIIIIISLVATYFMARNSQRYVSDIVRIFPPEWQESIRELGRDFATAFGKFIKAEFIVSLITLFMSIAGLILLKAKYAIILGTITGIFGILPVLGVGIVLVPWAALAFLSGHTLFAAQLILLTSVITVMRHVVEPKILGDNVGLDPLFVLISMYIGLASTGVVGLILGPFILIAYKALQKAGVFRNL